MHSEHVGIDFKIIEEKKNAAIILIINMFETDQI